LLALRSFVFTYFFINPSSHLGKLTWRYRAEQSSAYLAG